MDTDVVKLYPFHNIHQIALIGNPTFVCMLYSCQLDCVVYVVGNCFI